MRLVQILVVQLNQLNALVNLQRRELFELLAKQKDPELHWCLFVEVVKVFKVL